MKTLFETQSEWQKLTNGIVQLAQQQVLARFEKVKAHTKADGSLLTEADTEMQKATQAFLAQHWPQFALLGEESTVEQQNTAIQSPQGCWVLDPVDGTSNFASGIPFFSVSLALMMEGELILGLVYDPARDELFAARKGMGASLNTQPLIANTPKTSLKQCIGIIDFKRLPAKLALELAQTPPFASQRSFGSVALDWCWIAAGRGQIYCHGSQHLWDYAAGSLILQEAGGRSCTLEGENVMVGQVIKRSAVAATTPEIFIAWRSFLLSQRNEV